MGELRVILVLLLVTSSTSANETGCTGGESFDALLLLAMAYNKIPKDRAPTDVRR
jgi:hypothetical protein